MEPWCLYNLHFYWYSKYILIVNKNFKLHSLYDGMVTTSTEWCHLIGQNSRTAALSHRPSQSQCVSGRERAAVTVGLL